MFYCTQLLFMYNLWQTNVFSGLKGAVWGDVRGDIKPPTLYICISPPLVSNMWCPCWASNNSTTGSTPLLKDKVCVLLISYVTCDINVVSLDMVCNKHLLYTICYSLISEGNRHFKHLISCGQGTHPSPPQLTPSLSLLETVFSL